MLIYRHVPRTCDPKHEACIAILAYLQCAVPRPCGSMRAKMHADVAVWSSEIGTAFLVHGRYLGHAAPVFESPVPTAVMTGHR